ncbi:MAG: hypothetical protein U0794_07265 [Isosphaeraceae bacterium]
MGWTTLGLLACVVGWVDPPGEAQSKSTAPAAEKPREPAVDGKILAEYNARAAATPDRAGPQWDLALWCEKNGLKAEAYTHLAAVVRLDPTRAGAWQKLGFTKRDGLWLNPEELAESDRQRAANALWAPKLKAIHKNIHAGGPKQEAAEEALAAIDDPRAVPALFKEFGQSGATDQLIAVRALGHLASPLSSRLLATLSIYGRTAEIRRQSVETLRSREPKDYLPVLAGMLLDPIKYEVHPVGGPGSEGVLFLNGKRFNVRRVYRTPQGPEEPITIRPGDMIDYDEFGRPLIRRRLSTMAQYIPLAGTFNPATQRQWFMVRAPFVVISATQIILEVQRAAQAAQSQLMADMEAVDQLNREAKDFNEIVIRAARDASGKPIDNDPEALRSLLRKSGLYQEQTPAVPPKATYTEFIPLQYQPQYELSLILPFFKEAPFN